MHTTLEMNHQAIHNSLFLYSIDLEAFCLNPLDLTINQNTSYENKSNKNKRICYFSYCINPMLHSYIAQYEMLYKYINPRIVHFFTRIWRTRTDWKYFTVDSRVFRWVATGAITSQSPTKVETFGKKKFEPKMICCGLPCRRKGSPGLCWHQGAAWALQHSHMSTIASIIICCSSTHYPNTLTVAIFSSLTKLVLITQS